MEPINSPLLTCGDVLALLEKPTNQRTPEEQQILRNHLASCADCRAEARLRVLLQQSAEEPPAGLTESVMEAIRAERARAALRLRRIRQIGTAAAAVILIPAVVILAPDPAPYRQERLLRSHGGCSPLGDTRGGRDRLRAGNGPRDHPRSYVFHYDVFSG